MSTEMVEFEVEEPDKPKQSAQSRLMSGFLNSVGITHNAELAYLEPATAQALIDAGEKLRQVDLGSSEAVKDFLERVDLLMALPPAC